jgi:choice-of-anchor C domain-containing protein
MRGLLTSVSAAAALFAVTSSQASANLISDGDFSNPSGGSSFTTYNAGSTFGPWFVATGSVDLIGGYWQAPPSGGGSVDIDGNSPGSITQSFTVLTPGSYDLSFYLSGNPDGAPTTKTLDVDVGLNGQTYSYTLVDGVNSRTNMLYVQENLPFTVLVPQTYLLTFASGGDSPGFYGAVIGGVDVSQGSGAPLPTPLPGALALFAGGLGVIGLTAGRRKRKSARAVAA